MDIITKKLPEGVVLGGRFYPVHTDFKNWVKISAILEKGNFAEGENLAKIFSLCYKILPETVCDAFSGVIDFYTRGEKQKVNEEGGSRKESRILSLDEDSELIYAAFLSQYGIDLTKDSLHWYQFCALLGALSGEHKLFKVIYFRSVRLSDIKDREKRAFIGKMKRIYSLPDSRTDEEKSADLAESMAAVF